MSNHSGSYLLNKVLQLMERNTWRIREDGDGKQPSSCSRGCGISDRYDCNPGEILDEIGERFGICQYCLAIRPAVHDGGCGSCLVWGFAPASRLGDLDAAMDVYRGPFGRPPRRTRRARSISNPLPTWTPGYSASLGVGRQRWRCQGDAGWNGRCGGICPRYTRLGPKELEA